MILDNQKAVYDKDGLDYNPLKKQKFLKNIFVNSSSNKFSNITCFKYDKVGHKSYIYFSRKSENSNVRKIWVPKGTIVTNPKGSKLAWVPKVKTWFYVCRYVLHPKQRSESSILIAGAQDTWSVMSLN